MQPFGGEGPPPENGKRMRRPSVRLHQPYYENPPAHRMLNHQWNASKAARKPRTAKTRDNKNDVLSERTEGGETSNLNFDDEVVIGNWRNFSAVNRDRDFKRKRVRSSNLIPAKSRRDGGQEIGDFESEDHEQEEEEDLSGNRRIDSNLVVEDSNPSSRNHSFDDGNPKLSDDSNNVGRNQKILEDNQHSTQLMNREVDDVSNGVRMWLNDLGLGKYAGLFEIHGVDDEVLPLLTLEDLKDMGINEVGVRRKMYSSIQKLDKWFR